MTMDMDARLIIQDAIPVVDIAPLRDGSDPVRVAQSLHAASQSLGFIYIKGHGIPDDVIREAREGALAFFRAAETQKSSVTVSKHHRGWLAQGGAKMHDNAASDRKESFIWAMEREKLANPSDHPLRGPNQWPQFMPELEAQAMAWFNHAHAVAHHLMHGFALGLGLPATFFLRSAQQPLSRASYVYYPPASPAEDEQRFGVSAHTDFGVLTVLCQDDVGGLQVQNINNQWIAAPPIDGTLVVNVADLLSRWTHGAYKSTPHRVLNETGKERLSLVLAFDPDPETLIDSREVVGATVPDQSEPISCGDYLEWRFNKAFAYRRQAKS